VPDGAAELAGRAVADEGAARGATPGGRGGFVRALLVMTGVLALFFAPALLTAQQFLFRDAGRMHWPVKRYVAEQLRSGHLPQWNPYTGLGAPFVAGAIDAVQHPFNLFLVLFPFEIGFKLWVLLSYLVAASGGYAWARRLGRSWTASLAAGLAFALSGFLVSSSDNLTYLTTLAALPWVFAAAHGWLERASAGRLALVGIASGFCAAGGDPQAWGFAVLSFPLYAVALQGPSWRALRRGAVAMAGAFVGAAPFVLPVLVWLPHSSRGDELNFLELVRWSLPPVRLLELVVPHLFRDDPGVLGSWIYVAYGGGELTPIPWVLSVYVGAVVTALAVAGAVRARQARWFVASAAVFTWMALGPAAGFGRLLAHLPVLRGFRYWEKMAVWPTLLLAMAAAFGIDALAADRGHLRRRFAAAVGGVAAVALAAAALLAAFPERAATLVARAPPRPDAAAAFREAAAGLAGNLRDGLLEAGVVAAVLALAVVAARREALNARLPALLALVVVFDLAAANVRGYTLADTEIVDTRSPFGEVLRAAPGLQRISTPFELTQDRWPSLREFEGGWLWGTHTLDACFNVSYRVGNFVPYSGMPPARAQRFLRRAPPLKQFPHVGVLGIAYVAVPTRLERAREAGIHEPYDVAAIDPLLPAYLVRVPHRPRVYLAGELDAVDRRQAMEFLLEVDPSRSARSVVEGPLPADYRPPRGDARVTGDLPERVTIETDSSGPALLVLNDAYAAGWRATVDGGPTEILPSNYMARGVWVPAGKHRVEFTYRTPGLREGWAIFAVGGLAAAAWTRRGARRGGSLA
jgi:hypothetical protein